MIGLVILPTSIPLASNSSYLDYRPAIIQSINPNWISRGQQKSIGNSDQANLCQHAMTGARPICKALKTLMNLNLW